MRRRALTRLADRVLSPLIGKSLVVYLRKPERPSGGTGTPRRAPITAGPRGGGMSDRAASSVSVPEVPGILTAAEVLATAQSIAEVQRADGMIPWFPGGHCDPWNHVEAAMALRCAGWTTRPSAPTGGWPRSSWPTAAGSTTTWPRG